MSFPTDYVWYPSYNREDQLCLTRGPSVFTEMFQQPDRSDDGVSRYSRTANCVVVPGPVTSQQCFLVISDNHPSVSLSSVFSQFAQLSSHCPALMVACHTDSWLKNEQQSCGRPYSDQMSPRSENPPVTPENCLRGVCTNHYGQSI